MVTTLSAGAARAEIELPPELFPDEGFTQLRDSLFARVLVIATGEHRVALSVIDQTAIPQPGADRIREEIGSIIGADPAQVLVVASHSFSAPHLVSPQDPLNATDIGGAFRLLLDAVRAAAAAAVAQLEPVTVEYAQGTTAVAINRDVETEAGWGLGQNPDGFTDPRLQIIEIHNQRGERVATLMNVAVQSSVLDGARPRAVSGDLFGAWMRGIELEGGVAFALPGAAGDQAPRASRNADPEAELNRLVEMIMRDTAVVMAQTAQLRVDGPEVSAGSLRVAGQRPRDRAEVTPTRTLEVVSEPERVLPFWLLTAGDLALVGVQVELDAETGAALRANSPYALTLVCTMTNGAAKYLPAATSFDRFSYEAQSSRYAKGSAEVLSEAIRSALAETKLTDRERTRVDS